MKWIGLICLLAVWPVEAQNSKVEAQRRLVEELQGQIARQQKEIDGIKKGRATVEQSVRQMTRQIDSRRQLLSATERDAGTIGRQVRRSDSTARGLQRSLTDARAQYAEMVREAWRSHHNNTYTAYLMSARDFSQVARRIDDLRAVAQMRASQMSRIRDLSSRVATERERLAKRKHSLDSVKRAVAAQKGRLEADARAAQANIKRLSARERAALQQKMQREQRLDVAIEELRRLSKGNKEGASFSGRTSNLRLPVVGGAVKRYKGNMAEISGPEGARVQSIYEGKVVDVKRNRITGKYDVYVAHGEYISSYAGLGAAMVGRGEVVRRNEQIGVIGAAMNVATMQTEYKMVFGIYGPSPAVQLRAEDCFK